MCRALTPFRAHRAEGPFQPLFRLTKTPQGAFGGERFRPRFVEKSPAVYFGRGSAAPDSTPGPRRLGVRGVSFFLPTLPRRESVTSRAPTAFGVPGDDGRRANAAVRVSRRE